MLTQDISMLEIAPDIFNQGTHSIAVFFLLVQPGGCFQLWL